MNLRYLSILVAVVIAACVVGLMFSRGRTQTNFLVLLFGLMGLGLFAGGINAHARGDNSQHRGGRVGTYWYQEVAAGALMLGAAFYCYFSRAPIDDDKKS